MMAEVRLLVRTMMRNPSRLLFTLGSIAVAFALLGIMVPMHRLFEDRVNFANSSRLIVINKASIMRPLPLSYGDRLAKIPGVAVASHFTFFGAMYRDAATPVAAIATDARLFTSMVGEVVFKDPRQHQQWLDDPAGIAVGRQLAKRLDWSVGDVVPVFSTIYPRKDGNPVWSFRVAAIFDAKGKDGATDSMVLNYRLFDEARAFGNGTVGWYAVRVAPGASAAAVAKTIDVTFANSSDETHTVTERAFAQSFLNQVGDFRAMILVALVLVFWTLLLITANTMAQSIRGRFSDFAVLKTIGFCRWRIARLVFGESLLLLTFGGLTGLLVAIAGVPIIAAQSNQLLSRLRTDPADWALGLGLMALAGLAVAVAPAIQVARQPIVDGLAEAV